MTAAAIPTRYGGTEFRSRLEARWAAFFDLCGFPWRYEPFDCNGYIPDFLLFDRVLLEVKPIVWGKPKHGDEPGSDEAKRKLELAFPDGRFEWLALVGIGVYSFGSHYGLVSSALIGRCAERRLRISEGDLERDSLWTWSDFHLDWWPPTREFGLESQPVLSSSRTDEPNIEKLWREAGNLVQWRGRASESAQ